MHFTVSNPKVSFFPSSLPRRIHLDSALLQYPRILLAAVQSTVGDVRRSVPLKRGISMWSSAATSPHSVRQRSALKAPVKLLDIATRGQHRHSSAAQPWPSGGTVGPFCSHFVDLRPVSTTTKKINYKVYHFSKAFARWKQTHWSLWPFNDFFFLLFTPWMNVRTGSRCL